MTASGTRQNLVRPDCKQKPGRAVGGNELLNYLTLVKLDFTARGLAFSILLELGRGGLLFPEKRGLCFVQVLYTPTEIPFFPPFFLPFSPSVSFRE